MRKEIKLEDKVICYDHGVILCGKVEKITVFRPCGFSSRRANRIRIKVDKIFPERDFETYEIVDDPQSHIKVCHYKKKLWLRLREYTERRRMINTVGNYELLGETMDLIRKTREA